MCLQQYLHLTMPRRCYYASLYKEKPFLLKYTTANFRKQINK
jgi:hypothetical protein